MNPYDLPLRYFAPPNMPTTRKDATPMVARDLSAGSITGETGIDGLRLDFNSGLRLRVPQGDWHIRITGNGTVFFDDDATGCILISLPKFFIPWQVEAYLAGELVFAHTFDPTGQEVFCKIEGCVLGDTVMLLPYIKAFGEKYGCRIILSIGDMFHDIIKTYYPEFTITDSRSENTYASFYIGAFQQPPYALPENSRFLPAEYIGRLLLGLATTPPSVKYLPTKPREIAEPYVCIAAQASNWRKAWLYPGGWDAVVAALKESGYRVLSIDREKVSSTEGVRVEIPSAAEDFTGSRPLMERINLLAYADLFIGVSSGLSWLAKAACCPTVIISGLTLPYTEFDTPYRVINWLACHGCYNDARVDWRERCPHHHDTPREYECSKTITSEQVLATVGQAIKLSSCH